MNRTLPSVTHSSADSRPQRMLDLRGGGWVLVLAGVIAVATFAWHVSGIISSFDQRAIGDGRTLESYGYDLSTLLVPREKLYPIGIDLRKDGLPAMDHPPRVAAAHLGHDEKLGGVRYLLPTERVIGVAIGGEAVAYPLWVLDWHEIVNDTVGGRPIVVTYNGVCDSAAVFDRRVGGSTGGDNAERAFGFSGLLYNGNLVMYDRVAPASRRWEGEAAPELATGETPASQSLWSQLQMRAIAGPAAAEGQRLELIPFELTTWGAWREAHPDTHVILPDIDRKRIYKRDAYSKYRATDGLKFPVDPLPSDGRPKKTPIVAVANDDGWDVIPAAEFDPAALPSDTRRVYAYWFAWYAAQAK